MKQNLLRFILILYILLMITVGIIKVVYSKDIWKTYQERDKMELSKFSFYFSDIRELKENVIDNLKAKAIKSLFLEWDWGTQIDWFNGLISNVKINSLDWDFIEKLKIASVWTNIARKINNPLFEKVYDDLNSLLNIYDNIYFVFDNKNNIVNDVSEKHMFPLYIYVWIWELSEENKHLANLTLTTNEKIRYFKVWIFDFLHTFEIFDFSHAFERDKWLIKKLFENQNIKKWDNDIIEMNELLKSKIDSLDIQINTMKSILKH